MGIFDKLGDTIVETGQELKKMADQNSLQSDLRKKNKDLESLVYQIGLEIISNEPEMVAQKCPERYTQLMEAREQARLLRNQISLMNTVVVCPGCGRETKGASQFCVYCGSRLPDPRIDQSREYEMPGGDLNAQTQEYCLNCGAPLKPGAAFCTNCGASIQ